MKTAGNQTITGTDTTNSSITGTSGAITVNKGNTTTSVTSSNNPSTAGQSVTFTAAVALVAPASGTPSGTVQFVVDGFNFGAPVSLSGNTAQLTTSSLTVAGSPHSLSATYSGDGSYWGSKATDTLTVTPAPMPLDLSSAINPYVGISYLIQVQGFPNVLGGVAPTGTVAIYDGSTLISGPTAISGFAGLPNTYPGFGVQMPTTFTSSGDHSVTAKYSGDTNYAPATSQPQIVRPLYSTTTTMNVRLEDSWNAFSAMAKSCWTSSER